jgi:hypothetical protein
VVLGANLQADLVDAGGARHGLEVAEHAPAGALQAIFGAHRQEQQVREIIGVGHGAEAHDHLTAPRDHHLGVLSADEAGYGARLPAPAQALLDELARHGGELR